MRFNASKSDYVSGKSEFLYTFIFENDIFLKKLDDISKRL